MATSRVSLTALRTVTAVTAAVAAVGLAAATIILTVTVGDQQDRLAHQSLELECRGEVAAESDVVRNDVILWLSRGLRGLATGDQATVDKAAETLASLDVQLDRASAHRARTTELCTQQEP